MKKAKEFTCMGELNGNIRGCNKAIACIVDDYLDYDILDDNDVKQLSFQIERGNQIELDYNNSQLDHSDFVSIKWSRRCEEDIKVLRTTLERVSPWLDSLLRNPSQSSNSSLGSSLRLI